MAKITLDSFELEFEAPEDSSYAFGGEVRCVEFAALNYYLRELARWPDKRRLLVPHLINQLDSIRKLDLRKGIYIALKEHDILGNPIVRAEAYIRRGLPEPIRTFAKGHEEGHILDEFKRNDLLEELEREFFGSNFGSITYPTNEHRANAYGILAVFKKFGFLEVNYLRGMELSTNPEETRFIQALIEKGNIEIK